jgi:hypothetical protein
LFSIICVAFDCFVVLLCLGSSEGLYSGNQMVVEVEAFNITSKTDVFSFIKWQKDSHPIVGALPEHYNVTD